MTLEGLAEQWEKLAAEDARSTVTGLAMASGRRSCAADLSRLLSTMRCATCRFWWPNVRPIDAAKREPCTHPDVRRMLGTVPMTEAGFACLTGWERKEGKDGDPPPHG